MIRSCFYELYYLQLYHLMRAAFPKTILYLGSLKHLNSLSWMIRKGQKNSRWREKSQDRIFSLRILEKNLLWSNNNLLWWNMKCFLRKTHTDCWCQKTSVYKSCLCILWYREALQWASKGIVVGFRWVERKRAFSAICLYVLIAFWSSSTCLHVCFSSMSISCFLSSPARLFP